MLNHIELAISILNCDQHSNHLPSYPALYFYQKQEHQQVYFYIFCRILAAAGEIRYSVQIKSNFLNQDRLSCILQ
jgi:hypothetical protein